MKKILVFSCIIIIIIWESERKRETERNNWTPERFILLSQTENLLFLFCGKYTLKKQEAKSYFAS